MDKPPIRGDRRWNGAWWELAIEYHPGGDDERVLAVLRALWSSPGLIGPWARGEEDGEQVSLGHGFAVEGHVSLAGVLRLPNGRTTGCLSWVVREPPSRPPESIRQVTLANGEPRPLTFGPEPHGSDWIDLTIPLAMSPEVLAGDSDAYRLFTHSATEVLLGVADVAYRVAPYDLALIGDEASGYTNRFSIRREHVAVGGCLLSPRFAAGLHVERGTAIELPSGVLWFPLAPGTYGLVWSGAVPSGH